MKVSDLRLHRIRTNRHTTTSGFSQGWIEDEKGNLIRPWTDGTQYSSVTASKDVAEHNLFVTRCRLAEALWAELDAGVQKFGEYHNAHEAYAIIKEEVDELWDDIKANKDPRAEALQVAATAFRLYNEWTTKHDSR